MKASPYGPNGLGVTCATMEVTRSNDILWSKSLKTFRNSNYFLKLENMKLESLVIVDQHARLNAFLGFVHTARRILKVGHFQNDLMLCFKLFFGFCTTDCCPLC